ncbi:hypothetical protein [Streptomyces sirii]|uniref:hypothetical protein n=1 Tax=Streptomyces sirii TaxID=3127701 RepID=UPI003D36DD80
MEYADGIAMYDVVSLGEAGLPGEVVAISGGVATVQSYEYTGGLAPGDTARAHGRPLSAQLGPQLLGGVFDGLLRPLSGAGEWLLPGAVRAGEAGRTWSFVPYADTAARVSQGETLGEVRGVGPVRVRVLVPPGAGGVVERISPEGDFPQDAVVAVVGGIEVRIGDSWPVRRPRPVRERGGEPTPLTTGQRMIDLLFPVARGSTVAVPGGFGTGKTVLLQQIAKWCDADVIVYIGCGERGNEMADVIAELAALEDPAPADGWQTAR